MDGLKLGSRIEDESSLLTLPFHIHSSSHLVSDMIKKWVNKFPHFIDKSIFNDLLHIYLDASSSFLDHRNTQHLFRLILSTYIIQKKLARNASFSSHERHLEVRW